MRKELICLILLYVANSVKAVVTCDANFYSDGFTCLPCKENRISLAGDDTPQFHCGCPPGTYGFDDGSSFCQLCPVNQWSGFRHTFCSICLNNRISVAGSQTMLACKCPPGTFGPQDGYGKCIKCKDNEYAPEDSLICTACPNNRLTYINQASINDCLICPAGTFGNLDINSACVLCPANSWASQGSANCTPCQYPRITYDVQASIGDCKCPYGTYGTEDGVGTCYSCILNTQPNQTTNNCPAGKYGIQEGSTIDCRPCEANSWSTSGSTSCTPCLQNRITGYSQTSITDCQCPAGTFGDLDGISYCGKCPPNSWAIQGSVSCTQCTSNRVTYDSNFSILDCKCPIGTQGPEDGISACNNCQVGLKCCPIGTQLQYLADYTCVPCPVSTWYDLDSGGCIQCPYNRVTAFTKSTKLTQCICPAGTYGPQDGVSLCITCPSNSWAKQDSKECTPCTNNRVTYYNHNHSITDCKCSFNQYGSEAGYGPCSSCQVHQCPAGTYGTIGTSSCTVCPANSWSALGSTSCTTCLQNRVTGNSQVSITDCQCPAGTAGIPDGITPCSVCPPNSWAGQGQTGCVACLNNRVTGLTQISQTDCKCPAGTYGPLDDKIPCLSCSTNTQSPQNACQCLAGTFSSVIDGIISCIPCAINSWAALGSKICTLCTYQRVTGFTQASVTDCQCPAGTYGSPDGISPCSACPSNSWAVQGSQSCKICANNRITGNSQISIADCMCPIGQTGANDGISDCTVEIVASSSQKNVIIFNILIGILIL